VEACQGGLNESQRCRDGKLTEQSRTRFQGRTGAPFIGGMTRRPDPFPRRHSATDSFCPSPDHPLQYGGFPRLTARS
jgi:hypothetical protein